MKSIKNTVLSALAAATLALLAGCSKPAPQISIGINAWPGSEFIYLAKVKGFYAKRGVEVKLVSFSSLADARRSFELGHLDGIACTLVEHCQILDNSDRNPQIALVLDYSAGGDVVIAREGIRSSDQLAGARIGLEAESLGVFILARLLEQASLSLRDVVPVKSDQLSLKRQMENGEIDVAITYPPHSLSISELKGARTIFTSAEIPNEVLDVLAFDADLIARNEDAVRAIISAIYEAQAWARDNEAVAYAIMAEREGISPNEFKSILENDLQLTYQEDQAKFFEGEALLSKALERCDAILHETGQSQKVPRFQGTFSRTLYLGSR
ncbi:ABC transporter substrate-binding protein [Pelagicoccus sp. SDUM812005]|uniref:ABC transporter substrate-binding protein n=1 Tax=Pelagicoccus sp. SDUM812005 TaxID=3041257 RepID=UPI00280DC273|nr:ABC transporter substrate-binding protein [Pelagicoccus sp. SDUM812005]MDQ8179226.1 ABC transporter substrate-binding protein [Pelagicoccus sp. SDUM812005]